MSMGGWAAANMERTPMVLVLDDTAASCHRRATQAVAALPRIAAAAALI